MGTSSNGKFKRQILDGNTKKDEEGKQGIKWVPVNIRTGGPGKSKNIPKGYDASINMHKKNKIKI